MAGGQTVLVLGGTGRTGRHVVRQALERGIRVRAIARSVARLPVSPVADDRLTCREAALLDVPDADLLSDVRGCDAVVSCLGHTISLSGIFGPPRDLVTAAVSRVCAAVQASRPARPVRLVLMSSVSVNQPGVVDPRRGTLDSFILSLLRVVVPPARDNQMAADFLAREFATAGADVEWVCVRPDSLLEGDVSGYAVRETLVSGLFRPRTTTMANVAHFMCDLVQDEAMWRRWAGRMPVIVNDTDARA